jgi:hypothetical protein
VAASSSSVAPVAERRVCSVLFCDVVGFTPLSESRDPEAVRELLSEHFEVARTVIGRYGGVVEKFKSPTTSPTDCSTAPLTSSPQNRGSGPRW